MTENNAIPNKRFTRVIPFAFVMYMIAYMDRNNIGYGFSGMEKSLHLSPTLMGTASGIFFIGYLLLQIPAGNIAKKYGTKKLLFFSQLAWGLLAIATSFVHNGTELMIIRFLLGLSESAMFPAVLVMVTDWFPAKERGRANSLWQMGSTVAGLLVGPVCGLILTYAEWQWLFILEGIPAVIWAFVWLIFIPDKPKNATFLSDAEREYLETSFADDAKKAQPAATNWKEALSNKSIWALIAACFLLNVGAYGFGMWLPTAVKNLTKSGFGTVGLLTALSSVCTMLGMYLISRHSDKTGERKFHAAFAIIIGAVMLMISVYTSQYMVISLVFLMLTGIMGGFLPIFWTFPPTFVSAESIGFVMGLINGIGNLGGFFGPTVVGYLVSVTGSTNAGLIFTGICWVLAGLIVLSLKIKKAEPKKVPAAV